MAGVDEKLLSQYQALNERAGVVELSGRSLIEVRGADRAAFLHNFCTNDVKRLQPGQGCEAFFTNHQGKTVGHGWIFADEQAIVLETTPGQAAGLIAHLDRFVISERIEFQDRSSDWTEVLVGGPQAGEQLKSLTGGSVPEAMLAHQATSIGGQPAVVRRVGFTIPPAWLVQVDASAAGAVIEALRAAGGEVVDTDAFDICRLEAGWPMFGQDITEQNLPQEIDRNDQAISFKKGCYLGQETVARLDALGHVNWLLVGLTVESADRPVAGAKLTLDDKEVGQVKSANWSPRLNQWLALALVRRTAAKPGIALKADSGTAHVAKLPATN